MALTYPTSDDTPTRLAIMPDWGEGVRQVLIYRTDILRSRAGLEQRSQRMTRPKLGLEYVATATDEPARRRIETILATSRGPLHVPWWTSGARLAVSMTTETSLTLEHVPIAEDFDQVALVYLWSRERGGEWRTVASRSGAVLTLVDELPLHVLYDSGAWCFPVRLAVRDRDDSLLETAHQRAATDRLLFRTL